jgi:hypothetical protein
MKALFTLVLLATGAAGQATTAGGGVEAEWDLRTLLKALTAGTQKLKPILDQVNPAQWKDTQAGQSYAPVWKSTQDQIEYLGRTAASFSKEPERLTLALEVYFRLQSLQTTATSLVEGVRKYQNPAVGDLLASAIGESLNNGERLRTYITELAQTKEQEFKVMDQEAQRCRGVLSRQTPSAPKSRRNN